MILPKKNPSVGAMNELREAVEAKIEEWRVEHLPREGSFRQAADELERVLEEYE